jgi:hypothetical protein
MCLICANIAGSFGEKDNANVVECRVICQLGNGILEKWNTGMMEQVVKWKNGMMEYWNIGVLGIPSP